MKVRPFTMSMSFMLSATFWMLMSPPVVAMPWLLKTPLNRSSHSARNRLRCSSLLPGMETMMFGVASL